MTMKPPLYDEIHQLALDIVNASAAEDERSIWSAYHDLELLCKSAEVNGQSHPFHWETLADFTTAASAALNLYKKALKSAEQYDLVEDVASKKIAMAELYAEAGDSEKGVMLAKEANEAAKLTSDLELKREISEFLLQHS